MQKNFGLFIVSCIVIFMVWYWLQQQLWPPRPRDPNQIAKNDGAKKDIDKKALPKKDDDKKKDEKKDFKPPEVKPEQKAEVKAKPEVKPEPAPQTIVLGGDNSHLQVLLTTRGAGVQKLTLNRFKAADYLGRPVDRNLDLIPDDSYLPSFLMYHYAEVDAEHPVFGLGEKTWQLEGEKEQLAGGVEQVKFSIRVPGQEHIKITKTYRLGPKDYHVTLLLEIERDKQGGDAKALDFRYQLTGAHGLPVEGEWYTGVFRKGIVGMLDDRGTLVRELDNEDSYRISNRGGGDPVPPGRKRINSMVLYAGVTTQYFASVLVVDEPDKDKRREILAWARPTLETTERLGTINSMDGDTIVVTHPDSAKSRTAIYQMLPRVKDHIAETRLAVGDAVMLSSYEMPDGTHVAAWIRPGTNPRPFLDDITVRVNSEPISLSPGAKVAHQFMLYHGPVKTRLLGQFSGDRSVDESLVDRYTDTLQLRTLTDYRSPGPFGAFASAIRFTDLLIACTKLMHNLLYFLNLLVFGYHGLSIILLTVLVRGLMFPISRKQALFSIKMQALVPEQKKIQEKYKNDPQGKTQAMMELYRKHNVHPLGGCLPMFLQLPIFLGLYYALQESISFRLAGFLWIENLAAPDMLVWWSENIPLISSPNNQSGAAKGLFDILFGLLYLGPYLNLLPIFAVGLMVVQQKLMTPPPTDEQQALNQKVMKYMMIFMGLVFYKVASGLCIYFIASSLWGLAERKLLPKKKNGEAVVATPSPNGKAPPSKPRGKGPAKPEPNGTVRKVKDWWAKLLEDARKK